MIKGAHLLFAAQLFAHLSIIPMILLGEPKHYLIAFAVYFLTGCFGMSMTFHRLLSHQSWVAPGWFKNLGIVFGSLGLTGTALAWAAVHRSHHRFSDQIQDPHSPNRKAWWRVQFLSMYYAPKVRDVKDLIADPFVVFAHRHYFTIQAVYVFVLFSVDPFAIVYAYLFPAAVLWQVGSSVNTFGHLVGYRRYRTGDLSRNNPVLGLLLWGEGWHNNHHRYPRDSSFSRKWFELDVSFLFIRFFEAKESASVRPS